MSDDPIVELFDLRDGVLVVIDPCAPYDEAITSFQARLWQAPERFGGDTVIIDVADRLLTTQQLLDLEALINGTLGVRVVQIVNNEAAEVLADESLDRADLDRLLARRGAAASDGADAPRRAEPNARQAGPDGADGMRPARPESYDGSKTGTAYLLRRTIRSGQRVAYQGSVVILGDVNPGAEIIATGDIVVVGALRGLAHAGARGHTGAVVAALDLRPVQLRIGSFLGRGPEGPPRGDVRSVRLAVARVGNGRIVVEEGLGREAVWARSSL
ncbi:MAG: septum site-determining protein MinC [Thermaerobacterales bacterium]